MGLGLGGVGWKLAAVIRLNKHELATKKLAQLHLLYELHNNRVISMLIFKCDYP